jgi:hypothetical protein
MYETSTLSRDLHVHPGRPAEGRWGNGENVRTAAPGRAVGLGVRRIWGLSSLALPADVKGTLATSAPRAVAARVFEEATSL